MTRREQIHRERLLAQILVEPLEDGEVSIFCPSAVSERLHQYLAAKRISSSLPKRAIFGTHPDDELIVSLSPDNATAEVREFVASLPFGALPDS
jgi:hypothetical protein